jgi:outer membrane protein TolC
MTCLSLVAMLTMLGPAVAPPAPLASARQAQSAPGAPIPLTLEEAIAQGLANSRRLAEIEARAEAADFAIAGRQAAGRPLVALQGGYTRTNHVDEFAIAFPGRPSQVVYPDIPDNYRSRIDLQWPIYTGGRTGALERAARAERGAIGRDLDAARADLRLEITRAFWAVATARETEAVLQRSLEVVLVHVKDARARLDSGLIPPNDVSSAEAQASHQRLLALEAAAQRAIAEADLRRLTGNDAATATPAVDNRPPPPAAATAATADVIAAALKARPERQALEQRVASADSRAAAVAASARPQIALGGGYDYARPNPRIFPRRGEWQTSWDTTINVSWTLWDGGRRAAEHGEALATAASLKTRVDDFDRQVTFEVRARALDLDASTAAVTAADDEIRAAAEAERVVNERYKAGVTTGTDVLDAQVARLQAELDRTRALANVRLAEARLERALGR